MITDNLRIESLTPEGRKLADNVAALLRVWPSIHSKLWNSGNYYHDGMLAQERITCLVDAKHALQRLLETYTLYRHQDVVNNPDLRFSRADEPAAKEVQA
jgi:hypothetical protein